MDDKAQQLIDKLEEIQNLLEAKVSARTDAWTWVLLASLVLNVVLIVVMVFG